jgi:hypothetical protein
MIRAARLDPTLYDEVASDPRALLQAMVVVVLSAVATGISFGQGNIDLVVQGMVFALLGWWVTAYLAFFVGTKILHERRPPPAPGAPQEPPSDPNAFTAPDAPPGPRPDAMLRALGFANAPGLLRIAGAIPDLAVGILLVTTLWMICASVVAIRQSLGFQSTGRAIGVYVVIQLLLVPLLLALVGSQVEAPVPAP